MGTIQLCATETGTSIADFDAGALGENAKEGEDALAEGGIESVEVGHVLSIVEAQLPSLIVQVDTEAPELLNWRKRRLLSSGQCLVFLAIGTHTPDLPFLVGSAAGFLFAPG